MSFPKQSRRPRRLLVSLTAIIIVMAVVAPTRQALAQTTSWTVFTGTALSDALAASFQNSVSNPSLVNTITLGATISGSSQWVVNANVNIVGGGYTINMNNADRAFFIAGGTVGINNLSITNGNAAGGSGGGGGAGLGGAIFVGSGSYYGGVNPVSGSATIAAQGLNTPVVSLRSVTFSGNQAVGGAGSAGSGGGMGGNGSQSGGDNTGQGGGGFGAGANGGAGGLGGNDGSPGSAGAFVNVGAVGGASLSGGAGGNGSSTNGGLGGANGGGGGGGGVASFGYPGTGGGGGVAGGRGYFDNSDSPNNGGYGGFGGGGGSNWGSYGSGGNGGFGGGGGSGSHDGGNGGFGGGGGGAAPSYALGQGGFGAANAQSDGDGGNGIGGGGLGAGGALFVMPGATVTVQNGTFSGNSVAGGTTISSNQGSAYGTDVFLGANVTFDVATNLSLSSLGGAGNLSDPNVAAHASDPNAHGGVIKTGYGTLILTGTSYYSGATTIHSGTLALAAGASEQGTTVVTVGQNAGDVATLQLGSSSMLALAGWNSANPTASTDQPVMIAQYAGSTGTVVIGDGPGSNGAFIAARTFTGGSGTASVVFTQQYAAEPGTNPVYPFYTTLTGSLSVVQKGLGTTVLNPQYGDNTFVGSVTVDSGTLATAGTAAALAGVTEITVNSAGALMLGQTQGVNNLAGLHLAGGVLQTGTSLSETFGGLTVSGSTSAIDFLGNAATLNFATLDLGGHLSIWNYSGTTDFFEIATGTATGSLEQISFYSDAGTTFLGYGGFESTRIVPVPEPSTIAMALAGLAAGGMLRRRRKRAASPRSSSPS